MLQRLNAPHAPHRLICPAIAFLTGTGLPVSHSGDGEEAVEEGGRLAAAAARCESPQTALRGRRGGALYPVENTIVLFLRALLT